MTSGRTTDGVAACGSRVVDAPTDADHRRARAARCKARARFGEIEAARDAAASEAFRVELGAVVRSASPMLGPMLAAAGRTLDEMAERIEPPLGWPRRPRLSRPGNAYKFSARALWHYLAAGYPKWPPSQSLPSCEIRRGDGDYIVVRVVEHSLELAALIGRVRLETRFGELRVEPLDKLPETILAASAGRLLEEIVDHDAWRGRGWRIVAIEEADGSSAQTLVVATGSIDYRMPWSR